MSKIKISNVPYSVKCFFNEPGCEEGDIDGWTIVRGLAYFIIGLIVPNQYLAIITISIILEVVQPFIGNNPRYIINPLVSLTGYAFGSIIGTSTKSFKKKYDVLVD